MRERENIREPEGRTKRMPLGVRQAKLAGGSLIQKGHKGRWINDIGLRIQQAKDAGYTHVTEAPNGKPGARPSVKRHVGVNPDGSPMYSYLMQIRQEFYDEDQAAKMARVDETDNAIRRGDIHGAAPSDTGKYYTPREGITLR